MWRTLLTAIFSLFRMRPDRKAEPSLSCGIGPEERRLIRGQGGVRFGGGAGLCGRIRVLPVRRRLEGHGLHLNGVAFGDLWQDGDANRLPDDKIEVRVRRHIFGEADAGPVESHVVRCGNKKGIVVHRLDYGGEGDVFGGFVPVLRAAEKQRQQGENAKQQGGGFFHGSTSVSKCYMMKTISPVNLFPRFWLRPLMPA